MRLNRERSFFRKIADTAHRASSERAPRTQPIQKHSIAIHSISMAGLRKRRKGYCLLRTPSLRGKQFL